MAHQDRLTKTAWIVVRLGKILNRVFLVMVLIGLVLTWIFAGPLTAFLVQSDPGIDGHAELIGVRLEMLVGIGAALATDRLLAALRDMLVSARAGNPFMAANANRLQTMGWALLALQLLDIPATLIGRFFPGLGSGDFSLGGWMAVLLLFVLSRVFAKGALMRDELEGTI